MPRKLEIRLGAAGDALDRFEAAWHRVEEGRAMRPLEILSFPDLPTMLKTLSPARWALLQRLREEPLTIYELAKRLEIPGFRLAIALPWGRELPFEIVDRGADLLERVVPPLLLRARGLVPQALDLLPDPLEALLLGDQGAGNAQ